MLVTHSVVWDLELGAEKKKVILNIKCSPLKENPKLSLVSFVPFYNTYKLK